MQTFGGLLWDYFCSYCCSGSFKAAEPIGFKATHWRLHTSVSAGICYAPFKRWEEKKIYSSAVLKYNFKSNWVFPRYLTFTPLLFSGNLF